MTSRLSSSVGNGWPAIRTGVVAAAVACAGAVGACGDAGDADRGGSAGGGGEGNVELTRAEVVDVISALWDHTYVRSIYQDGIFEVIRDQRATTFASATVGACPDGGTVAATQVSGDATGYGDFSVRFALAACAAGGVSGMRRTVGGTVLWTGMGDKVLLQGRGTMESSLTITWGNQNVATQVPSSCTIDDGAWSFDVPASVATLTATLVCDDGHAYACTMDGCTGS